MAPKIEQAFFNSVAPIVGVAVLVLDFIGAAKSAAVEKLTHNPQKVSPSFVSKIMGPYV